MEVGPAQLPSSPTADAVEQILQAEDIGDKVESACMLAVSVLSDVEQITAVDLAQERKRLVLFKDALMARSTLLQSLLSSLWDHTLTRTELMVLLTLVFDELAPSVSPASKSLLSSGLFVLEV
jgi:hypothetical protein